MAHTLPVSKQTPVNDHTYLEADMTRKLMRNLGLLLVLGLALYGPGLRADEFEETGEGDQCCVKWHSSGDTKAACEAASAKAGCEYVNQNRAGCITAMFPNPAQDHPQGCDYSGGYTDSTAWCCGLRMD